MVGNLTLISSLHQSHGTAAAAYYTNHQIGPTTTGLVTSAAIN